MDTVDTRDARSIEQMIEYIRPAVRGEREYLVGAPSRVEVKLNQNESPFDLPGDLKRELMDAFVQIPFNRYPNEQPNDLRDALGRFNDFDPEGIIVGNGSNELTYTLGMGLIPAGAPVVLPRPMFSLYEKVVRLCDGNLVGVAPRDDLSFDTDALLDAIRHTEPHLTVLTTPNNPTGRIMSFEDIERIVRASPGFVLVDEAYVEFNPEPTAATLISDHPNVMVMRTLSKGFGLAGLRLGYLMACPEVARELMKSRLPFMVDRFSEAVGLALLERPDLLEERVEQMKASAQKLYAALDAMDGVEAVPTHANFILFSTDIEPGALQDQLVEQGVLIRNMSGYPELPRHLRVNAGTPDENKAFLTALEQALHAHHEG